jgi:protein TonB
MKATTFIFLLLCCFSCYSQKADSISLPIPYLFVDEMPRYEGGNKSVKEFIEYNIQWPGEFDGQGTVLVSFVVTKDGKMEKIIIEKGLCDECNTEAIRLIKLLTKWVPGKVDSKNVDVLLYIPIKFKISD